MGRNINGGVDKVSQSLPLSLAGKVFFVGNSSSVGYNDIVQKYKNTGGFYVTIDSAINACLASRGDTIFVAENHAETLTTAGAIALDVAGVKLIGLGVGNNRPRITFGSTDNAATFTQSGDNTKIDNIV